MGKDEDIVCVIMFGYGRGPTHCNAHTWVGLRFGLTLFKRTNINKMQIKD
jgi:hypothetical protein